MLPLPYAVPVVSAIIERVHKGTEQVLVQTRWKPGKDPKYSGTLEIPAGTLEREETVYAALHREVFEETGLRIIQFKPDIHTRTHNQRGDQVFAFLPFCCQQEIGERARVGFVFLCQVEDREPVACAEEARDARWVSKDELRRLLAEHPDQIFAFQLGTLDYYLNYTP